MTCWQCILMGMLNRKKSNPGPKGHMQMSSIVINRKYGRDQHTMPGDYC